MSNHQNGRPSVTIIGGGASGVLLAAHLLRDPETDIRVTLVERRGESGQGVAYSASQRDHKVNVPARGMSAFADDPEHFWRWLQTRGYPAARGSGSLCRAGSMAPISKMSCARAGQSKLGRLIVLSEEVIAVHEGKNGVETVLANGTSLISRTAVPGGGP
ncbi:FAD/NAD(P)-binding protein [Devosia sp. A8/3-2]|nr:FAD/NAD(P)-binding protein [Devosia sp. A8/3-2]